MSEKLQEMLEPRTVLAAHSITPYPIDAKGETELVTLTLLRDGAYEKAYIVRTKPEGAKEASFYTL